MTTLAAPLGSPIFEGAGTSTLVPFPWPVAIDGHPYEVELQTNAFRHSPIPLLRQPQDSSAEPGEQSINPASLWRRTQESWHLGAGQTSLDRPESDRRRFRSSKGVDVWTPWQISLMRDTASKRASGATNLQLVRAGTYLYVADGNEVYWTQDVVAAGVAAWTAANIQAGEGAQAVKSVASDGNTVYAALGSNGIHTTTRGAAVSTHFNALAATLVGYVKGRLMAAQANSIFNVTASGAAPSALLPHPNSDFSWVGFAAGTAAIYAAGYSGDKSLIYRTAVKADGTALDVPVIAGELPDGEIIRSIDGYLGLILLGTDKGVRFAEADNNGDLVIGPLIELGAAVRCFEGQGRFAWFGWTNYDGSSTGLGRLDLHTDTGVANVPTPAYASDLMAVAQGNVLSAATFQDRRVFAVSGSGVWAESSDLVAQGSLDTGLLTFGIADAKIGVFLDVRHQPLNGSHRAYIAGDGGAFTQIGSDNVAGRTVDDPFPVGQLRAETFEIRQELYRSAVDTTLGPVLTRHTLRANPSAVAGVQITVPLRLFRTVNVGAGVETVDVLAELVFLERVRSSGRVVTYQELTTQYAVTVESVEWVPNNRSDSDAGPVYEGVALVTMKTVV